MAIYDPTAPALASERSSLLIAPGGPVTRVVAVMAADDDLYSPQFVAGRLDRTTLAVAASCVTCWLAPSTLRVGGLL